MELHVYVHNMPQVLKVTSASRTPRSGCWCTAHNPAPRLSRVRMHPTAMRSALSHHALATEVPGPVQYASLSKIPNVIHCEHYWAKRQEDRFALAS